MVRPAKELENVEKGSSKAWKEPPIQEEEASEIADTFTFTGDRVFHGRIQVSALTTPQARFTRLTFTCNDGGKCKTNKCSFRRRLTLSLNGIFDPSAFATYFDTNRLMDAVNVYAERVQFPRCTEWRRKLIAQGEDERAITHAIVLDLTGREGRAWFVHSPKCDLRRAPNWIICYGYLCRGARGRIGVFVREFTHESEVLAPSRKDVKQARNFLRRMCGKVKSLEDSGVYKVADILRRECNAKGEEVAKGFASDLLTVASPVWISTVESQNELGATTCELGPSTNYKSQRARFLVAWLGAGKYARGRKTEAGLTAGLEKMEGLGWVAKKGLLPSADLSYIIIDNMPPHALDEQIESRRDGIVAVSGIKTMEVWSRCRLKLLSNPQQPFEELVYKCTALKMFDHKLIARFTFAIYTYGVPADERYNHQVYTVTPEEEEILRAAKTVLQWNLSRETHYRVPKSYWPKIMHLARNLEEKYGVEDVPLILRNIPYKLSVLAYSFGLLEGYKTPKLRHFRLASKWIEECAKDIELDKYAENQRAIKGLTEEEYETLKQRIHQEIDKDKKEHGGEFQDTPVFKMVKYLVSHGKAQRDELCASLEVGKDTVTKKVNLLKGLGLLKSGREGYAFTPKGVMFVKRWLSELSQTDQTDQTVFGGQTGERANAEAPHMCDPQNRSVRSDLSGRASGLCEVCGKHSSSLSRVPGGLFGVGSVVLACPSCIEEAKQGGGSRASLTIGFASDPSEGISVPSGPSVPANAPKQSTDGAETRKCSICQQPAKAFKYVLGQAVCMGCYSTYGVLR